ncbi:MAG: arsenate reductase ArsC [candidate division Zixibacteria bacterium]|nr:arsenate reductase ArsC [candidate division Zixibacteria bacterium]
MKEGERKIKVLFVCTGNSCRSQMAEGWANHLGAGLVEAYSAGVYPVGVAPLTVKVMAEAGVDISHQRAKAVDEFLGEEFDYVITLCDNVRELCPYFPDAAKRFHWPVKDAFGLDLDAYRRARDEIRARVEAFLNEINGP